MVFVETLNRLLHSLTVRPVRGRIRWHVGRIRNVLNEQRRSCFACRLKDGRRGTLGTEIGQSVEEIFVGVSPLGIQFLQQLLGPIDLGELAIPAVRNELVGRAVPEGQGSDNRYAWEPSLLSPCRFSLRLPVRQSISSTITRPFAPEAVMVSVYKNRQNSLMIEPALPP